MDEKVVVHARDIREFKAMDGDPHMVALAGQVWVIPADYYCAHLRDTPVIATHAELDAAVPEWREFNDVAFAELLTDFHHHR